jgi:hypothetical protein
MGTTGNAAHREPWNKGKIVGQKAPFKLKDIWALRARLQMEGRVREGGFGVSLCLAVAPDCAHSIVGIVGNGIIHYALNPGGVLLWVTDRASPPPAEGAERAERAGERHVADLAKRALLQSFAPAAVVTDLQGNILYVHGDTGPYLRPAPGQPTHNVVEMARDGLQLELREALRVAVAQGTPTSSRPTPLAGDGERRALMLTVRPLPDPDPAHAVLLVSFQGQPAHDARGAALKEASCPAAGCIVDICSILVCSSELTDCSSSEELKSTNEELQSTNPSRFRAPRWSIAVLDHGRRPDVQPVRCPRDDACRPFGRDHGAGGIVHRRLLRQAARRDHVHRPGPPHR